MTLGGPKNGLSTRPRLGIKPSQVEVSVIAQEIVRDVVAQNTEAWNDPAAAQKLQQIVALHEVGHQFLGAGHHEGVYPSFIMRAPGTDLDEQRFPEMQLRFSPAHVDEIRENQKTGTRR